MGQSCAWKRELAVYTPSIDCRQADPTCFWCKRSFLWWSGLEIHISKGHCPRLDLRRAELDAITSRSASAPSMHTDKDLTCHCVLCGRWFPATRGLSKHLRSAHLLAFKCAKTKYCKADLSKLRIKHECPFCHCKMDSQWNMRTHVRSHCLVLLQRFLAGFSDPTNPEQPGLPAGEQASADTVCDGEASLIHHVPSVGRSVAGCVGSTLREASKARQVRRRLRGKQRDPQCADGRFGQSFRTAQASSQASPQATAQAYQSSKQGSIFGHVATSGPLCEEVSAARVAATGSDLCSQSCLRVYVTHGSSRSKGHCFDLSRNQQDVEECDGVRDSREGVTQSSDVQDDHGLHGLEAGRTEQDESWRSSLRLLAERCQRVLRADLGSNKGMFDCSTGGPYNESGGTGPPSGRTCPQHSSRSPRASQGLEATHHNLSEHFVACPDCTEPSERHGHENVGDSASIGESILLVSDRQQLEARPRQAEQPLQRDHEAGLPATFNLTVDFLQQFFACLRNPRAVSCYMNAVHHAFQGLLLHRPSLIDSLADELATAITAVPSRPAQVILDSLPSWQVLLRGWALGRQEDVGEFLIHILSQDNSEGVMGTVGSRRLGYQDELQPHSLIAIPVPMSKERLDLMQLIDNWACPSEDPGHLQWLHHPPLILMLHLQRYCFAEGIVQKNSSPIDLVERLSLPVLPRDVRHESAPIDRSGDQLYQVVSVILHHGSSPQQGHYTSLCFAGAGEHSYRIHLNDDALPRALTPLDALALCSRDMYIVCLVRVMA